MRTYIASGTGTEIERGGLGPIHPGMLFYESDTGLTYIGNEAGDGWDGPIAGSITGGGAAGQVTYWSGPLALTSDPSMIFTADGPLHLLSPTATNIALILQSSDDDTTELLTEWRDSGGNWTLAVGADGDLWTDRWLNQAHNTFLGVDSAGGGNLTHSADTEGWYNTGVGGLSLFSITAGDTNSAFGYAALRFLTTGSDNMAMGFSALNQTTIGYGNMGVGARALELNTEGTYNSGIGTRALYSNTTGDYNIGIGERAGYRNQTGGHNIYAGYRAGYGVATNSNSYNIGVGRQALYSITTGGYNVCFGRNAGYNITNQSYQLHIDSATSATNSPLIYGEFDNDLVRLNGVTALTNAVHPMLYKRHQTSGAAAALFGIGTYDELEDSAGNAQVASEQATLWATATAGSESPLRRWTTYPIGSAGPGYMGFWTWDDLDNNARTVIPGGAGDVTAILRASYVFELVTGGNVTSGEVQATPGGGAVDLYNAGGEQFTLTAAAGGDVTVVRAAGTDTARVSMILNWI